MSNRRITGFEAADEKTHLLFFAENRIFGHVVKMVRNSVAIQSESRTMLLKRVSQNCVFKRAKGRCSIEKLLVKAANVNERFFGYCKISGVDVRKTQPGRILDLIEGELRPARVEVAD